MEREGGVRITTWNVNGIRNPFGYQPWRQVRTFAAMFDILEADIVVMQETKIQRKDLRDDMVLVPGWDVYFSLPKHKKGYSGVAIYTRNSICAPIRAEEGITGALTPPNSDTSFYDLPEDQQIGGYPTPSQLSDYAIDAATLDSEGRCVILEFPAFVLIGTYCPARRDESRDEFRLGFVTALDARVRNLVAAGKRVFLTGDLNMIRDGRDCANLGEDLKKMGMTMDEYLSTPARRIFNHLLVDGIIIGERDEGREDSVMWDLCRSFHPDRKGMFTCWETKINARPGNYGSRIDHVLCSQDWKDWFCDSNIQEGLMGSDHCPVYATLKHSVEFEGEKIDIRDIMSDGMFKSGVRKREWGAKDLLPMSAKLIPEFDRRRSIRDMFTKKPTLVPTPSTMGEDKTDQEAQSILSARESSIAEDEPSLGTHDAGVSSKFPIPTRETPGNDSQVSDSSGTTHTTIENPEIQSNSSSNSPAKRPAESSTFQRQKKSRTSSASRGLTAARGQPPKGQSSLMGFFKPKTPRLDKKLDSQTSNPDPDSDSASAAESEVPSPSRARNFALVRNGTDSFPPSEAFDPAEQETVIDPIVAKEGWSKLLSKRVVPRCEHNEPCVSYTTKKPGINRGRSFYMCPRPLGPSGSKEKNTQWRCGTFIWSSDWTGDGT